MNRGRLWLSLCHVWRGLISSGKSSLKGCPAEGLTNASDTCGNVAPLACDAGSSKVAFVMQVCRWEFLVFNGTFKTLLRVHEAPQDGKLVFSLIKSSFMKDFVGQWQVSCWQPASYTAALERCRGLDAHFTAP